MATCDLSIITVSWNVWDLLRACLTSLERASAATEDPRIRILHPRPGNHRVLRFEVVLVDAASADITPDAVPALFPWVRLLAPGHNVGFSLGNNIGARASQGAVLFFLNPDTLATADAIMALYEALQASPHTGAAGPRLITGDGQIQESRRRFPHPVTGFLESTWLGRAWPGNPWQAGYRCRSWPADFTYHVDWLEGAALMIRRDAFAEVSGFDTQFFMYCEELDLCRRLQLAGWRILYCADAHIIHFGGRSSEQVPAQTHIIFNTSKILYYRKYFGMVWAELMRHYLLLEFGLQMAGEFTKLLLGHKPALRKLRVNAYRQVLACRLRPPADMASS